VQMRRGNAQARPLFEIVNDRLVTTAPGNRAWVAAGASALSWRARVDREGMHAGAQLGAERVVDQAVALEPASAAEGIRHDVHPKVRLAARPMAGMASMEMGFVGHLQVTGRESSRQLLHDQIAGRHDGRLQHFVPGRKSKLRRSEFRSERTRICAPRDFRSGAPELKGDCQVLRASAQRAHIDLS
jgi:hypothetical protein